MPGRTFKNMKTLIICKSIHHGNTEKIARVMAKVLKVKLLKPEQIKPGEIKKYGLIGFGSGIYAFRHHISLLKFADKLPKTRKRAFIFSTAGFPMKIQHLALRKRLLNKGFTILGEFNCKGFDTFGPLKLIRGLGKGRPDRKDLENAERFVRRLKNKK